MATLLISHPSFLEHDTGPYHPERPDRLRAILGALEDPAFDGLVRLAAPAASIRVTDAPRDRRTRSSRPARG